MTLNDVLTMIRLGNGIKTITISMTKELGGMRYAPTKKENSFEHKNTAYKPFKLYESKRRNMIRR